MSGEKDLQSGVQDKLDEQADLIIIGAWIWLMEIEYRYKTQITDSKQVRTRSPLNPPMSTSAVRRPPNDLESNSLKPSEMMGSSLSSVGQAALF